MDDQAAQNGKVASDENSSSNSGNLQNSSNPEIEKLQTDLAQMTEIAKRALADMQNIKRRSEEDMRNSVLYANQDLIKDLLPAIDNLQRALVQNPPTDEASKAWIEAVKITIKQLWQILEKRGLKKIETLNQTFNPVMHEALVMAKGTKDIVVQELEPGYTLNERVIKMARVAVGNGEE